MIVMMAGLPGTGKSTLARALAERLEGMVLDKDVVRAALFAPGLLEYSAEQDDFCMEIMLKTAGYLLKKHSGLHVLLDGRTFSKRYQRERVIELCPRAGTKWAILECVCSEETALHRLAAGRESHMAKNRTAELYREIRDGWETIEEPKLVVDTDRELGVDGVLQYLRT
jgi:predicted kinase